MKRAVNQHFVIGCVLAVVGGVIVWTVFGEHLRLHSWIDMDRPGGGDDNFSGRSDQTELWRPVELRDHR